MPSILSSKDDEVALLKAKLVQTHTEGPGSDEMMELKAQNASLSAEVADLKDKLLNHHMEYNARPTLVV